jgi:hypothetical protein
MYKPRENLYSSKQPLEGEKCKRRGQSFINTKGDANVLPFELPTVMDKYSVLNNDRYIRSDDWVISYSPTASLW